MKSNLYANRLPERSCRHVDTRQDGYLMPAWQQHHIWRVGHLWIDEQVDWDVHRTVHVARFKNHARPTLDLMPPLHDVQIVSAKPDRITL